jgi:hypothetical protein
MSRSRAGQLEFDMETAGALDTRWPALAALNSATRVLGPGYLHAVKEHAWEISWGVGCSAGSVIVETAPDPDYAGTWSEIATIAWTAASRTDRVNFSGSVGATRVRVSDAIVGGTVVVRQRGIR